MTKHIYITETPKEPLILDEDIRQLKITVLSNQKAVLYQKSYVDEQTITIKLEEGAIFEYLSYHKKGSLDLNIFADLDQSAYLSVSLMTSSIGQINILPRINLRDIDSSAEMLSVFLSKENSHLTCNTYINHERGSTTSQIMNYVIAQDDAKVIINNNTTIRNQAKFSNANQIIKGLNLSKSSKIVANPNLFIDEYDVNAHHGAAIGAINQDDLFYLMSRGLPENDASKIIVMGFIQPLLDQIKDEEFKKEIMLDFEEKLK